MTECVAYLNVPPRPLPMLQGSRGFLTEVPSLRLIAQLLVSAVASLQENPQWSLSPDGHVHSPPSLHHGYAVVPTSQGGAPSSKEN